MSAIGLILQTPADDDLPFIILSITRIPAETHQRSADWVCLLFAAPHITLKALLSDESFPSDYAPLAPDFMFLPAGILKWQVEQTRDRVAGLLEDVIEKEKVIFGMTNTFDVASIKNTLFEQGKKHLKLRNRWLFEQELAENMSRCFDEIARRQTRSGNSRNSPPTYSRILLQRVQTLVSLSRMLKQDLATIPSKIQAQHQMVTSSKHIRELGRNTLNPSNQIDARLNIMIAQNSAIAAEEARRDSSSMKTIAALTLIFLPATFVASIFSMSMFNWQAESGGLVTSRWIWVYFVIAIPLTLMVLVFWILWYKWTQAKYSKRHGKGSQMVVFPDSA
ncbi:uncharacterized protein Z518_06357 [Rhinocladiella mackenziei CBS 650.93]|uniref:Uncharacterized protein n=1 Tax=Rhinocladiella mackenziei CBS 650.93 TaxID=1442369 RepID=A0A0D2J8Q7_9EURO|nr:uncharacterized protein Z518_06357 [Rhinocladiella mackenziei CBS 650.93]KIX05485.1 hypothetical protein Z518_06357 [Rhinocladiella mackenziei CBS 650.93]